MRALLRTLTIAAVALLAGAAVATYFLKFRRPKLPDPPIVVEKIREVARLETLNVTLYKTVTFAPDPQLTGSVMKDALSWAKFELLPDEGKAIVFAEAHVGLNLERLTPENLRVRGDRVEVKLPPLITWVELKPGDTQVIDSNLDSQQTMQLMELAKGLFEHEVNRDAALRERARASSERAIRALLITLGYREIVFVPDFEAPKPG